MTVLLPRGSHWQIDLPIDSLYLVYPLHGSNWIALPPKGSYLATLQTRSVTSSILGSWAGVSSSGPLRATLPTKVVTVFHVGNPSHLIFNKCDLYSWSLPQGLTSLLLPMGLGILCGPLPMIHLSLDMLSLPGNEELASLGR